MAYGIEVYLGWKQERFRDLGALGLRLPQSDKDWEEARDLGFEEFVYGGSDSEAWRAKERLDALLHEAQKMALAESGVVWLRKASELARGTVSVYALPPGTRSEADPGRKTMSGETEISNLRIGFHFDPDEMEEEKTEAVLGMKLVSRYWPTFLDWERPSGGSGGKFLYGPRERKMVRDLKDEIVARNTIFASAEIIVAMNHY